ncbi:hypothetical protein SAMN05518672_101147 [Chitinophaga sp. CF118]|uniref:hypothetical protein n=1 Tax=Chitinophaga sp. CF118 TaxID=1884367 RepID=UPI0008E619B4|nr:hypothetical protein [Chitinophaga sp. CF118]SFD03636.1 hypothetical protein SAMN05518672_101147 [Chitinophaga sp. CF118]
MKFSIGLPLIAIVCMLAVFQVSVSSCGKDETIKYDTVTVRDTLIVRDTITLKDTAITLELITSTPWKLQEIRGVNDNTPYYYLRGGSSNTQSFDHEYITFKTDMTGVYTDEGGTGTPMTWKFVNAAKTIMTYTIPFPSGTVVDTLEHLTYKNGGIRYGEYFYDPNGGRHVHSEAIRIPKNATSNINLRLDQ